MVSDDGVVGEYLDLEKAKQKQLSINSGNKIIVEVNSMGAFNTDPEQMANFLKEPNFVAQDDQIYKLLTFCEEYLQNFKGKIQII